MIDYTREEYDNLSPLRLEGLIHTAINGSGLDIPFKVGSNKHAYTLNDEVRNLTYEQFIKLKFGSIIERLLALGIQNPEKYELSEGLLQKFLKIEYELISIARKRDARFNYQINPNPFKRNNEIIRLNVVVSINSFQKVKQGFDAEFKMANVAASGEDYQFDFKIFKGKFTSFLDQYQPKAEEELSGQIELLHQVEKLMKFKIAKTTGPVLEIKKYEITNSGALINFKYINTDESFNEVLTLGNFKDLFEYQFLKEKNIKIISKDNSKNIQELVEKLKEKRLFKTENYPPSEYTIKSFNIVENGVWVDLEDQSGIFETAFFNAEELQHMINTGNSSNKMWAVYDKFTPTPYDQEITPQDNPPREDRMYKFQLTATKLMFQSAGFSNLKITVLEDGGIAFWDNDGEQQTYFFSANQIESIMSGHVREGVEIFRGIEKKFNADLTYNNELPSHMASLDQALSNAVYRAGMDDVILRFTINLSSLRMWVTPYMNNFVSQENYIDDFEVEIQQSDGYLFRLKDDALDKFIEELKAAYKKEKEKQSPKEELPPMLPEDINLQFKALISSTGFDVSRFKYSISNDSAVLTMPNGKLEKIDLTPQEIVSSTIATMRIKIVNFLDDSDIPEIWNKYDGEPNNFYTVRDVQNRIESLIVTSEHPDIRIRCDFPYDDMIIYAFKNGSTFPFEPFTIETINLASKEQISNEYIIELTKKIIDAYDKNPENDEKKDNFVPKPDCEPQMEIINKSSVVAAFLKKNKERIDSLPVPAAVCKLYDALASLATYEQCEVKPEPKKTSKKDIMKKIKSLSE